MGSQSRTWLSDWTELNWIELKLSLIFIQWMQISFCLVSICPHWFPFPNNLLMSADPHLNPQDSSALWGFFSSSEKSLSVLWDQNNDHCVFYWAPHANLFMCIFHLTLTTILWGKRFTDKENELRVISLVEITQPQSSLMRFKPRSTYLQSLHLKKLLVSSNGPLCCGWIPWEALGMCVGRKDIQDIYKLFS